MNSIGIQEWIPETLEQAIDHIRWLRKELQATRILWIGTATEADNCPVCCERMTRMLESITAYDANREDAP